MNTQDSELNGSKHPNLICS